MTVKKCLGIWWDFFILVSFLSQMPTIAQCNDIIKANARFCTGEDLGLYLYILNSLGHFFFFFFCIIAATVWSKHQHCAYTAERWRYKEEAKTFVSETPGRKFEKSSIFTGSLLMETTFLCFFRKEQAIGSNVFSTKRARRNIYEINEQMFFTSGNNKSTYC